MAISLGNLTGPSQRSDGADGARTSRTNERPSFKPTRETSAESTDTARPQSDLRGQQGPAGTGEIGSFPFLRRRTDAGQPAEQLALELPGHLERRRAWREARGLDTFHAQRFGQVDDGAPDAEGRATALGAYRQFSGRGRLDIQLAQRVSVTV
jgi:hypothetical protein